MIRLSFLCLYAIIVNCFYTNNGKEIIASTKKGLNNNSSRQLIATVQNDKTILQAISPAISKQLSSVPGFIPWSSTGDPCSDGWEGITCNENGEITAVDFQKWYLSGPYDGFCASGNKLNVDISVFKSLSFLSKLTIIDLGLCGLTGSLQSVTSWTSLTSMDMLDLEENNLTGILVLI